MGNSINRLTFFFEVVGNTINDITERVITKPLVTVLLLSL